MSSLSLHYDFLNNPSLTGHDQFTGILTTPDLSITRATTKKVKDSDGWLRTMQAGEASFSGATFRNNLLLQSEDFSTGWTNNNTTDSADSTVTPPDGITTVTKLADNLGAGAGVRSITRQDTSIKFKGTYVYSVYAKAGTASWLYLYSIGRTATDSDPAALGYFNLSTGVVGSSTTYSPSITSVGGGWYRCSILLDRLAWDASTQLETRIGITHADGSQSATFSGGEYLYIAGAMVEDASGRWDSENLITRSNDFSNAAWTESAMQTIVAGDQAVSDPDGGTDAWTLYAQDLGTNGTVALYTNCNLGSVSSGPGRYRYSVALKAGTITWVSVTQSNLGLGSPECYFDLANGAQGSTGSGIVNSGMVSLGGGWYRCWFEVDVTSADTNGTFWLKFAEGNGDTTITARNPAQYLYAYAAQLERTKPAQTAPGTYKSTTTAANTVYSPSPYIATTTAAVSSLSGTSDGLLVEEARTNLCLQSEDFSATWVAGARAVLGANATIAPDGSLTADKIIDNEATGTGTVAFTQNITQATSTTYCVSIFLKADQLSWALVDLQGNGTQNCGCSYNLATGAVGTEDADTLSSGIEDYGNGWYRCWFTYLSDAADTSVVFAVFLADSASDVVVDLDGTSSIFVWGAQLEAGSFPTSYIPTTTASVTRNADNFKTTDVTWYDQNNATWYVHAERMVDMRTDANEHLLSIKTTTSDRMMIRVESTTGKVRPFMATSSVTQFDLNSTTNVYATPTEARTVVAYQVNDAQHYTDGTDEGSDTSVTPPPVTNLDVGQQGDAQYWNGLIKEIGYFQERFDNSTLALLSAGTETLSSFDFTQVDRRRRQHYQRQKVAMQYGGRVRRTWAGH